MENLMGSMAADRGLVPQAYLVRSVERACDILASFRRQEEVLHLSEVARRCGLHKATTFRLLSSLVSRGLLERVGSSSYRAGFAPLQLRKYRLGYAAQSHIRTFISAVNEGMVQAANEAGVELIVLNNKASRV